MAKLNLVQALNQIQEESFTHLQTHPFYGLRDGKGWLTRYPIPKEEEGEFFISRELAADLCFHGVNFDSKSVWGVSPYTYNGNYWNKLPLRAIEFLGVENFARLYKEAGRVDEFPDKVVYLVGEGFYVNPEISLKDLRILTRGSATYRANFLGVTPPPPMTWGRWNDERKSQFIAKKLAIRNGEILEFTKEHRTSYLDVIEIFCRSGNTLLYSMKDGKKMPVKTINNIKVSVAGNYYGTKLFFAWREGFFFSDHAEGYSLKEAIENLKNREELKGLSLSLRMIKDKRKFCFHGTLGFLKDRMPHVARLLQGFDSWEEVPGDIMDIVWDLNSRDIFEGYPEP